jgi:hypothetical protein
LEDDDEASSQGETLAPARYRINQTSTQEFVTSKEVTDFPKDTHISKKGGNPSRESEERHDHNPTATRHSYSEVIQNPPRDFTRGAEHKLTASLDELR